MEIPQLGALWDGTTRANLELAFNAMEPILSASEAAQRANGWNMRSELARPLSCYFPLMELNGTSLLGNPNDTPLTLSNSAMLNTERGLNYNGSNRAYVSIAAAQGLLRSIMNLDSLTSEEMIVVYGVLKHPTTPAGPYTIFYWGCDGGAAPEGWGLQIASNGKFRWRHRALGASSAQTLNLNVNSVTDSGSGNNNNHTAFALGVSATSTQELEISLAMLHLAVPGSFTQVNRTAVHTLPRVHNGGSRPARWSTVASLTLGAYPNNTENNLSDIMATSWALQAFETQRRPRDPGVLRRLVRQLAISPYSRPAAATELE